MESIDADLSAEGGVSAEIELSLSSLARSKGRLLGESSLGQWLLTKWLNAERSNARFALTTAADTERFVDSHPGKLLALLPHGRVKDTTRQAAAQLRDRILRSQNDWPGLAVEPTVSLYCADTHPFGLPRQLYPTSEVLTNSDGFRFVVRGLIGAIGANRAATVPLAQGIDTISTILFELFKNTHDHARTTAAQEIIGHSVRALYARYYDLSSLGDCLPQNSEEAMSRRLNPAEHYAWSALNSDVLDHRNVRPIHGLLELSVFDSGPGLAARWHGAPTADLPITDEMQFVLACLSKGHSTSSSLVRGFGLWNVLQRLRLLHGFFRIRTNRIHGYRSFGTARDAALQSTGELKGTPREVLFDWRRALMTVPSEHPNVAGTLISVLLPLR